MNREEIDAKKKMIYEFVSSKEYRPMSIREMAAVLQVPAKEKKDFRAVLDELRADGRIHLDLKGKIKSLSEDLMTGKFMATQKGFGFVRIEGEKEDVYISSHKTKGALDGDTVQISLDVSGKGKRREGEVVNILERANTIMVGTYSSSKSFGFVVADNHKFTKDIYIPKAETRGAVTGHKVVVEIMDFGSENRNPEGRILEIIGHINDPGVDILSVIKAYGLPEEYPDDVMDQVEGIEDEVSEEEKKGRADYRNLQTVTIDGEDAKDLDDAITLSKEGDIYHLGVHIADVSHYVTEKSPLDREALKRGTSVYLVDRVIPMIPHKLSNGICSLNQGTDRLALSCMMDINEKGEIIKHRIEESVINVDRRMSYTSVHKIVEEKDTEECRKYETLIPMFELMYELAEIMRNRRFKRGSIDFDFPESKITLDEKGKPLDVSVYERNNAHRIIEEFMLAANQTVAEDYYWQELPFVYRTHETPDSEKIQQLGIFINNFGYTIKTGAEEEIHPKEIQKLIHKVEGTPEEALISRLALRSMKQAKYTTACEGHFGLAMKYYCHFTSPIRRYPDLQIHRIIKENLHGKMADRRIEHYNKILPEVTVQASMLERRADDAEREVEKMKKAEYMEQFVGECFQGVISGVTSWGMYVELPNTIEGMIRVADIPGDYYYFEEENYQMVGERTHKVYKLGESIKVKVDRVDKVLRTIDFVIPEEDSMAERGTEFGDSIGESLEKKISEQSTVKKEKAVLPKKVTMKGNAVENSKKAVAGKGYGAKKSVRRKKKTLSAKTSKKIIKKGKFDSLTPEQKKEIEKAFARKIAAKKQEESRKAGKNLQTTSDNKKKGKKSLLTKERVKTSKSKKGMIYKARKSGAGKRGK